MLPKRIRATADSCIYCGDSVSQSSKRKSTKAKGVRTRKRKMLVKKPTPYPIKRVKIPRGRPINRKPMPTEASNQRRAEAPPCEPGLEEFNVMMSSQLGAMSAEGELSPLVRGIIFGLRLGVHYNQELGKATGKVSSSSEASLESLMKTLAENQAHPSGYVSSGNPSLGGQKSDNSSTPSGTPSQTLQNMPPVSAELIQMALGCGNQPECSVQSTNLTNIHTQTDAHLPVQPSIPSSLGNMIDRLISSPVLENNSEHERDGVLAEARLNDNESEIEDEDVEYE